MKRIWVAILSLALGPVLQAAYLVPPLEEELSDRGSAYVIVTLQKPEFGVAISGTQKIQLRQMLDEVIGSLFPAEFKLGYKFATIPCFSGHLTKTGLEKLSRNPMGQTIEFGGKEET